MTPSQVGPLKLFNPKIIFGFNCQLHTAVLKVRDEDEDEDAYVDGEVEESGHPLHSDSGVILGHYSYVLWAQGQCH